MRVLVAEDDPGLCSVIERGLQENGYVVDAVSDGSTALAYLQSYEYDVAVFDWRMPNTTGIEAIATMRRRGDRTPVLMLTARDTTEDRVAGLLQGADDYLVKPFSFRELLARLTALQRRPALLLDPVLRCGNVSFDPSSRVTTIGDRTASLTAIETGLLELLLRRTPSVVTRRSIANQVWSDESSAVGSNTIDVHMGRLRSKLGDATARIETVRGHGVQDHRRMRRPGRQWAHAARVALGATAVVGVAAVVIALVVNLVIVHRLERDVDARLTARLAQATTGQPVPLTVSPGADHDGDLDDAPTFLWRVDHVGVVSDLGVGAPPLPRHGWSDGTTILTTDGSTFRFASAPSDGGWLVAGESVVKIDQVRGDLILVELALGALLLVVTFAGSFVVGLRASAPIEQIRRRQAEFTADASHELRTPLSVIQAEVELALSRDRDPPSYRATLERVASESERLRSIVNDLLWLARHDADAPTASAHDVTDVAAVARRCAERFEPVATAGSIALVQRSAPDVVAPVTADPEGVERLVSVLVDNACRYAGDSGTVEVRVVNSGGEVTLSVDDSGPGIPTDQRDLVLDRFHRADDRPGGTGLGLAIADAVVRSSDGTWSIGRSALGGAHMAVSWRVATGHSPDAGPGSGPASSPAPTIRPTAAGRP